MTASRRSVRHPMSARRRRAGGMTLVEVAIAMALTLLVISGVGYAYLHQRSVMRHHEDLMLIQGGARLALEEIGRDIRQAGYIGCNSALVRHAEPRATEVSVAPAYTAATLPAGAENFTIDAGNALRVFRASESATVWGGSRPTGVVDDTHVIEVRYASPEGATRLSGPIPAAGTSIPTMGPLEPGRGDDSPAAANRLALLGDCQSAMIIRVDSATATQVTTTSVPITPAQCMHASRVGATCVHWPSAVVMPIRVVQYYVADLGTTAAPDRRLMARKRVMSATATQWNTPRTVLVGVRDLHVSRVGLDGNATDEVAWRVTRLVEESTAQPDAAALLTAADLARVARVDLRLSMQASRRSGTDETPVIRNFESSFAIRARSTQDPT